MDYGILIIGAGARSGEDHVCINLAPACASAPLYHFKKSGSGFSHGCGTIASAHLLLNSNKIKPNV